VVSEAFAGLRPLQRHQLVYRTLGARMGAEIHALSIRALTPAELAPAPEPDPDGQAAGGGGRRLEGEIRVSGAKNAALPILCATLLADDRCASATCRTCMTSRPPSSCSAAWGWT
jgi:hypothetical protein